MALPERVLQIMGSAMEYLEDRGELTADDNLKVQTHTRYTQINEIDALDVIFDGRMIRITAEDIGEHTHEYRDDGECDACGDYNEDFDDPSGQTGIPIQVETFDFGAIVEEARRRGDLPPA